MVTGVVATYSLSCFSLGLLLSLGGVLLAPCLLFPRPPQHLLELFAEAAKVSERIVEVCRCAAANRALRSLIEVLGP